MACHGIACIIIISCCSHLDRLGDLLTPCVTLPPIANQSFFLKSTAQAVTITAFIAADKADVGFVSPC